MVLLAASCEQEELPGVGADGTQTRAITVTDGGYAPADRDGGSPPGVPQTRAVENGYITKFTAGDACGLYIVRDGELAYANVKLTATAATDGTLTWQPEAGVTLTGGFNGEAGVGRGEQRRIYDQRRRDILPQYGIKLIEISYSSFNYDSKKKIIRNRQRDILVVKRLLLK